MPRESILAVFTCAAAVVAAGCASPGPTQTVTRSVELDHADSVAVNLTLGAGELTVDGGSPRLMDATFRFNVPSWEPVVNYTSGAEARLDVRQPGGSRSFGRTENRWALQLSDGVPMDLTAGLGASEARLTLGTLDLRGLTINQGVGELTLDLRGSPTHSYDVHVKGGVGSARIHLPRSVGIEARAANGVGSVRVDGLEKRGDTWYNPGHENDPVTIRVDVTGGVGEIAISADAS
jgi:N-terminal domain of toast_rack, DUF2154